MKETKERRNIWLEKTLAMCIIWPVAVWMMVCDGFSRAWDRFETFSICFFRFFHRVWRYRRVLARDYDFDWSPLVWLMELKLKAMAGSLERGCHVGDDSCARDCRVAAELCRRLRDDYAFEMHKGPHTREWARRIQQSDRIWQEYLGLLIGKRLGWWWD